MFIATFVLKSITAPTEPNVAAQTHRAPLERGFCKGGGRYKHLVPPGPKQCSTKHTITTLPHLAEKKRGVGWPLTKTMTPPAPLLGS